MVIGSTFPHSWPVPGPLTVANGAKLSLDLPEQDLDRNRIVIRLRLAISIVAAPVCKWLLIIGSLIVTCDSMP